MAKLDAQYWEERYQQQNTPWDIGNASPPIQQYMDQIEDRSKSILIPGAGLAHDAIALHQKGFSHVWVCDWAASAFDTLLANAPDFPKEHLMVADFFKLEMQVDILLEQTFFCAIDPSKRPEYVEKAAALLKPEGRIAGLLFADHFAKEGPPFGGTKAEYLRLFSKHFNIVNMELAANSIKPRAGSELFFEGIRK
jgi:SAM-dependent methyltransferase